MDHFNHNITFTPPVLQHGIYIAVAVEPLTSSTASDPFWLDLLQLHPTSIGLVLLAALLGWLIHITCVKPHLSPLNHLPSPNQGFAILRLLHEPNAAELEHWLDTVPNHGIIRYFGLWNEERIFAVSPTAVKDLLVARPYDFVKPKLQYILAKNISAEGLLIQEGHEHKAARKAFGPAYTSEKARKSYAAMWTITSTLADVIEKQTGEGSLNAAKGLVSVLKPISATSIDIIGRLGFSKDFEALTNSKSKFGKAYIAMFKTTKRGEWTLDAAAKIGPKLALALPLRAVKTIRSIMTFVHQTAEDIVQEHEYAIKYGHSTTDDEDMLTTIMKTNHFSHAKLVDQTVHILAAGTETVSGSMAWAIHLLSRHPDNQSRLRQEIRENIPSISTTPPESLSSILENLPYLNAVLKEVLRFHSINTILWRQAHAPTATLLSQHIPIGSKVVFSPWTCNRDPVHWGPDARTFHPERWLSNPATGGANHSYAFLTFGAGSRRCIGEAFARAQMRCVIAGLVGRFEFLPLGEEGKDSESDVGEEIGDFAALTLFKIWEGWCLRCRRVEGW